MAHGGAAEVPQQTCSHSRKGSQLSANTGHNLESQVSSLDFSNFRRFLMPKMFTIGEVLQTVRLKLNLRREQGLILMAGGKYVLKQGSILEDVYMKFKDEDGFLYLVYAEENIYG